MFDPSKVLDIREGFRNQDTGAGKASWYTDQEARIKKAVCKTGEQNYKLASLSACHAMLVA
ncbi:MAG: hypothetical protein EH225_06700 [Calditrichaeota bacterium]|nr:hypothetical protein [Calditrichota bacterium]RQW03856.1 MAG: hypothetical protein EH225_06700 [Calditrichota bacterium]